MKRKRKQKSGREKMEDRGDEERENFKKFKLMERDESCKVGEPVLWLTMLKSSRDTRWIR